MADNNDVVIINLDRPRELRFSHKVMKKWSAFTGKSIMKMDTDSMTPKEVEQLMYFMMEKDASEHGESLKLDQMEDLLDMVPLGVVYSKLADAMSAAFPKATDEAEKNVERAADGTGMKD